MTAAPARFLVVSLAVVGSVRGSLATAGDALPGPPAPAQPAAPIPPTPDAAAEEALKAVASKDVEALKALALRDEPDPWLVSDALVARGEHDAAEAFARAAPRPDVESLPAYVASRRGKTDDGAALRATLAAVNAAFAARRPDRAIEALAGVEAPAGTVVGLRLRTARGLALAKGGDAAAALPEYVGVARDAESLGWLRRAGMAFELAGEAADLRGDRPEALRLLKRNLAIAERSGRRRAEAAALLLVGAMQEKTGALEEAVSTDEWARAMFAEEHDRAGEGVVTSNMAGVFVDLGRYDEALATYDRAMAILRETGDELTMAHAFIGIATLRSSMGEFRASKEAADAARERGARIGSDEIVVAAMLRSAGALQAMGRYDDAMRETTEALDLSVRKRVGNLEADAWMCLGSLHEERGEPARALTALQRALEIQERIGDRIGAVQTRIGMSGVQQALGRSARALDEGVRAFEEAGKIDYVRGIGIASQVVANALEGLERYDDALAAHQRALEVAERLKDPSGIRLVRGNLANLLANRRDFPRALEALELARAAFAAAGDLAGVARCGVNRGRVLCEMRRPAEARALLEALSAELESAHETNLTTHVLRILARARYEAGDPRGAIEASRTAIDRLRGAGGGLSEEEGSNLRGLFRDAFSYGLAASVAVSDPMLAARFLEDGRAGALLEALSNRDDLRRVGLPPSLLDAEADARAAERQAAGALRRAVAAGSREAQPLTEAFEKARERVRQVVERIQREAKRVASVAYPVSSDLRAIQAFLREGDALLLYGLAVGDVVCLVVTRQDAQIVPLGKADVVAAACDAVPWTEAERNAAPAIAALRALVVAPLALPEGVERVLVSPEGPLSYVPFAALLPDRTVAFVPSGTTYGVLLADRDKRGEGVLALGDPDYVSTPRDATADDVYLPSRGTSGPRGGTKLTPLPSSGPEATAVGTVVLLGKQATESGFRRALGKRPRWHAVHFACHGIVDLERPTLSSLALTPGEGDDGFLTALEVFRTEIPADLAVLSACQTGIGKVVQGEGIVGLTRAFMFAGAPRVIVSLWDVDDDATGMLMTKFYERWNAGVPAAKALKDAQAHVRAQPKWSHPAYWAAWVLWGLPA